jgi:hypothetical protein
MPINTSAFICAQAGALAGMAVTGWVTDPTEGDYQNVVLIATAFATAFDSVWDSTEPLDLLEQQLITAVCQQQLSLRGPGPLANPVYQNPSNWLAAAQGCVALIQAKDAYDNGLGLSVPIPGNILLQGQIVLANGAAGVYFPQMTANDIPTLTCIDPSSETQGILSAGLMAPGFISASNELFPVGGLTLTVNGTASVTFARGEAPSSVVGLLNTAFVDTGTTAIASVQGSQAVYIAPTGYNSPSAPVITGTAAPIFDFVAALGFVIQSSQNGDTSTVAYIVFP